MATNPKIIPGDDPDPQVEPSKPFVVPTKDVDEVKLLRVAESLKYATPLKLARTSHNSTGTLIHSEDCRRYGSSPDTPTPKSCRCSFHVSPKRLKALRKANAVVSIVSDRSGKSYRTGSYVSRVTPDILNQMVDTIDTKEMAKDAADQAKHEAKHGNKINKTKSKAVATLTSFLLGQCHDGFIPDFVGNFDAKLMLELVWERDPNSGSGQSKLEMLHPDVVHALNYHPQNDKKDDAGTAFAYLMSLACQYFMGELNPDSQMEVADQYATLHGDIGPSASNLGTLADIGYEKDNQPIIQDDKLRMLHKVKPTGFGADDFDKFDHFTEYDKQ